MAKAGSNGSELKATIDAWAKAQAELEKAQEAVEAARAEVQKYARTIYEALGNEPFTVAALGGRGYRAIHKPERDAAKGGGKLAAQWSVLPLPENKVTKRF